MKKIIVATLALTSVSAFAWNPGDHVMTKCFVRYLSASTEVSNETYLDLKNSKECVDKANEVAKKNASIDGIDYSFTTEEHVYYYIGK